LSGHSIMLGLFRKPLVIAIVALAATNAATFWAAKHYHSEYSRAVAECNADKLASALEAEKAARRAQEAAHAEEVEILTKALNENREAVTRQHRRLQELVKVRKALKARLDEEIKRNWNDCFVEHVPDGVWNALRGGEAGGGGGGEADPDPAT